jgi:hypothetical protein
MGDDKKPQLSPRYPPPPPPPASREKRGSDADDEDVLLAKRLFDSFFDTSEAILLSSDSVPVDILDVIVE